MRETKTSKQLRRVDKNGNTLPVPVSGIMELISIAVQNNVDMDKMQQLMDLKDRHDDREAKKAFLSALSSFQTDVPTIKKGSTVDFKSKRTGEKTNYKHATMGDIKNAISPHLDKHGLSYRFRHGIKDGKVCMSCVVSHRDGYSEEGGHLYGLPDNTGQKNLLQQTSSTMTYLQRYCLIPAMGLVVEGEDNDGSDYDAPDKTSDSKPTESEGNYPESEFLKNFSGWESSIKSKGETPDNLIAWLATKNVKFNSDQLIRIKGIK